MLTSNSMVREAAFHGEAEPNNQLVRIQPELLPDLETNLRVQKNFVVAWLQAVCKSHSGRSLLEIIQQKPGLFPAFLRSNERADPIQDYLVLRDGNIIVREVWQPECEIREVSRENELDKFRACRLREGFASVGMLCNVPPIPLRVLDFLEAQDLLRLSLVCKATHQAAHVLFMRENAVADRILSAYPLGSTIHPRARSRARVLRRIRIASLMHGAPEAIPVWERRPLFLPTSTAQDPCPVSLDWVSDTEGRHGPIFRMPGVFRSGCARKFRLLDRLDIISVLEKPQLEALLERITPWLTMEVAGIGTLRDIELLVRAAVQSGQPVLLRQWWKRRAKRKRGE